MKTGTFLEQILIAVIAGAIILFVLTPLSEKPTKKDDLVRSLQEGKKNIENDRNDQRPANLSSNDKKTITDGSIVTGANKESDNALPKEDYSSYINKSITNSTGKTNISITVIDENGNISSSISSSIANIYRQTGIEVNTGLFKNSFIHKSDFQELIDGNSDVIDKLKLFNYVDYIGVGKIKYSNRKGTLVEGSIISSATLYMNIISTTNGQTIKTIDISKNGNGVTNEQAINDVNQKLIETIKIEYSSLN
jgi:hypothetical protein